MTKVGGGISKTTQKDDDQKVGFIKACYEIFGGCFDQALFD